MTRLRVLALLSLLAVAAAALFLGTRDEDEPAQDALAPLRARAALSPCPTGISPELPKLTLPCLGGGPAVALQGKPSGVPTLVNIYASWCAPCLKEMPLLSAFAAAGAGKVALLGVDTADEQRLALLFAKDVGQTWNAVVDDDKVVLRRYASGPPVTLFVDPAGKITYVKVGGFADLAELRTLAARYLEVVV